MTNNAALATSEMHTAKDMEMVRTRLEDLEVKASYSEDMLEQLNLTIYQQQQLIERLVREVTQLKQNIPDGVSSSARNLRDDLPPHY